MASPIINTKGKLVVEIINAFDIIVCNDEIKPAFEKDRSSSKYKDIKAEKEQIAITKRVGSYWTKFLSADTIKSHFIWHQHRTAWSNPQTRT